MIDLKLIPDGGLGWLDASGPMSNIVLSTRVRLARNLDGMPFNVRSSEPERRRVLDQVDRVWQRLPVARGGVRFLVDELEPGDRVLLHERHLISKELATAAVERNGASHAAVYLAGSLGLMVNEEDHLRLQVFHSGFALSQAYADLERLDRDLGSALPVAFHQEFGYLTACPTNAGTGLRASVLIHLPGLVLTKEIAKVLQGLTQVGLTFRGLYGEGSEVVGNFFQLSNQTTLGKTEDELLDHLGKIVRQVVTYEEQARQVLLRDAPTIIEDKVWRAYALLRYARSLSFEETMNLLSGVRLGVGLKLIPKLSVYTLNKLLIYTQPAHLAALDVRAPQDSEQRAARASYVRAVLEEEAARGA
ncbi:MAG TPA: protein arginine kinase [Gemmatimonadales bacterium]|nr:protein arginine kinase [Gemmatimonadales bacterium]